MEDQSQSQTQSVSGVSLMKTRMALTVYRFVSYIFEGFVFFIVLSVIPNYNKKVNKQQAIVMSIMIASTLAVLDTFTSIGHTTRMGIGYGIGFGISGFPKM